MRYEVDWTVEVEADNPIAAAELARKLMRDPDRCDCGVFRVFDESGDMTEIDLELGPDDLKSEDGDDD